MSIIKKNLLIWFPLFIYFCLFSILSLNKYRAYNMAMVDLGRMDQAIWNTLHGRFLFCTLEFGNTCRMIMHSEPIYALISPLYLFFSDPRAILILQTLVVSLGALAVFYLAHQKLNSFFLSLCFLWSYLLYPPLQYGNLCDFHPDMLAAAFLLFSFYFLEKMKIFRYLVFLILALLCKEYVSLIVAMLGIYILFYKKNVKLAVVTFILGVFYFLITYKVIPGYLQGGKENTMVEFYTPLGSSIIMIFRSIILHPFAVFFKFVTFDKIANLLLLFLPVGFLSLLHVPTLAIGLPIFTGLFLTPFLSYTNHHNGTIIPFIFISSIMACRYLLNKYGERFKNIGFALGIFILFSSLLSTVLYGASPLSWRFWNKQSYRYFANLHQFRVTEHDKIADKFIKMIPKDVPVSASNHLASHLSQRETIYHFPNPRDFSDIDFVLVDLFEYFPPDWIPRREETGKLKTLLLKSNFNLQLWEDGILLLKRGSNQEQSYYLGIEEVSKASVQNAVNLSFNGRLQLLGYNFKSRIIKKGQKCRVVYYWKVLDDFDKEFSYEYFGTIEKLNREYVLVDIFRSSEKQIRILHLPAYLLHSPESWKKGQILKEEFEFCLPEDISADNYSWSIGLYVVPRSFFIQTEDKDLVPGTKRIIMGAVDVI